MPCKVRNNSAGGWETKSAGKFGVERAGLVCFFHVSRLAGWLRLAGCGWLATAGSRRAQDRFHVCLRDKKKDGGRCLFVRRRCWAVSTFLDWLIEDCGWRRRRVVVRQYPHTLLYTYEVLRSISIMAYLYFEYVPVHTMVVAFNSTYRHEAPRPFEARPPVVLAAPAAAPPMQCNATGGVWRNHG